MGNANAFEASQSNCDLKHYELRNDTGIITDTNKLPLLGFTYGRFQHGSARMIIGPLKCSSPSGMWLSIKSRKKKIHPLLKSYEVIWHFSNGRGRP